PENPARVHKAGIPFAFCTHRLSSAGDFLKSVRKAVERGLDKQAALQALTTTPAGLLGIEDQAGTIQKGKLASLVIASGDIFDSKTKILETWVAGVRFEHEAAPPRSLEGQYELTLSDPPGIPARLFLKIDGTSQLKATISQTPIVAASEKTEQSDQPEEDASDDIPQSLKVTSPALRDTQFSGQLKCEAWKIEGIARLSLTFTAPTVSTVAGTADTPVITAPAAMGTIDWPNGSQSHVIVRHMDSESNGEVAAAAPAAETSGTTSADAAANADLTEATSSQEDNTSSFPVNFPLGAFGRAGLPDQPAFVAFVHARIWTCGPDGILDDATLLIGNGKVVAVGQAVEIPADAQIIDVRGMQITPGIIDCHSHMATDGGVNESTQAITCEVRIGDFIDADDITIYRQLAGGVTSSNILHGSANPIGGQNQVIKLRWGQPAEQMKFAEAPQGVKLALGENVKQSNWSEPTGRYPQTRMGVEQLFRDAFEAAKDYEARWNHWNQTRRGLPPRKDLELEALVEILRQKRWIHCHSYRQDEILALLRILDEYKITIGTFQHILEGYKVADEMAKHGAMASAFSDWWAYKIEVIDAIPFAGALMHNAGVVVSFNSDDRELARHLNQEAAKAVKYGGVSPEEALKFVTLNPARQLRIDSFVGSLEPGKHADFVVWNESPLSNFARCEQTWIDGRRYFSRSEDEEAQQSAMTMRNTLIQKILSKGAAMRKVGEEDEDPSRLWPRHDEFCLHSGTEDDAIRHLMQQAHREASN
ncbi:MAG: amidohydrolase family protein, partial [Planctomycetaceae bacterium]|nr:amidohydrolase family protein [Planctomycetaceae bacterium]